MGIQTTQSGIEATKIAIQPAIGFSDFSLKKNLDRLDSSLLLEIIHCIHSILGEEKLVPSCNDKLKGTSPLRVRILPCNPTIGGCLRSSPQSYGTILIDTSPSDRHWIKYILILTMWLIDVDSRMLQSHHTRIAHPESTTRSPTPKTWRD